MRIIAFDSSLARSAFAAFDGESYYWEAKSFIKPADKAFPDARFSEWRKWAEYALDDTFDGAWPHLVIYEIPTTLGQGSGEAQIMLMMTLRELCAARKIPMAKIYPAHLKSFLTGNGKADKAAMMAAVAARVPEYSGVEDEGGDIADSIGMLLWAANGAPISEAEAKRRAKKLKQKDVQP